MDEGRGGRNTDMDAGRGGRRMREVEESGLDDNTGRESQDQVDQTRLFEENPRTRFEEKWPISPL